MHKLNSNPPKNFYKDVHAALKARHRLTFTPLDSLPMLHLIKKYRVEYELDDASGWRGAINQLLDEGIMRLRRQDEPAGILIDNRFVDKMPIKELTNPAKGITKDSFMAEQRKAIKQLAVIIWEAELAYRKVHQQAQRQELPRRARNQLVGIDTMVEHVVSLLSAKDKQNPVLIHGIGGIGKTSLAETAVSRLIDQLQFEKIAWVTVHNTQLTDEIVTTPYLLNAIIQAMGHEHWLSFGEKKQKTQLAYTLNSAAHLIIIDNIECAIDSAVVDQFNEWSGNSRFLLTSRRNDASDSDWSTVAVDQLSLDATADLIRAQAMRDDVTPLTNLSLEEIQPIYDVVGGNPLAIKLVVGLRRNRPLAAILDDIPKAKSKRIEELYSDIYLAAWQALSDNGRSLLEMMFSADEMGYDEEDLTDFSTLEAAALWDAVDELIEASLMEKSADWDNPLFSIHRLTASFLQTEIILWPDQ